MVTILENRNAPNAQAAVRRGTKYSHHSDSDLDRATAEALRRPVQSIIVKKPKRWNFIISKR
jgi:hypothetical protein